MLIDGRDERLLRSCDKVPHNIAGSRRAYIVIIAPCHYDELTK